MSEEYVGEVRLEINGKSITDFKSVTEGERELYGSVKVMNTTGHLKKRERPSAKVDYVVPFDTPEFDFTTVKGGTLTIDYLNGTRVKYTGVYTTKIGELKLDGEGDPVKTIEFSAKKRTTS